MERKEAINEECDVFVIGGGPGGCTTATLLARSGLRVILAEREKFPRFRLGESLVPMINPLLKELGVWEKMHTAGFLKKYGAEFYNSWGTRRVHNVFAQGLIPDVEYTFQVERAKFDILLLEHAREAGVEILQPALVKSVEVLETGCRIGIKQAGVERCISAGYVIDASGREAFTGRTSGAPRDVLPYPKRMAVYNHFTGIQRAEGREAGNIIVVRLPKGWFWIIPIDDEKTSVGAVSEMEGRTGNPEEFFKKLHDQSPLVRRLLKNAVACADWRITTDYCYSHTDYASGRVVRVGDSAGFIDPIFSSGVFLAIESGFDAARIITKALRDKREISHAEQLRYTREIKRGVKTFRQLIEAFYDDAGYAVFMQPTEKLKLFPAVNSVVAGNTRLGFPVWWRFHLFLLICRLNRFIPLVR